MWQTTRWLIIFIETGETGLSRTSLFSRGWLHVGGLPDGEHGGGFRGLRRGRLAGSGRDAFPVGRRGSLPQRRETGCSRMSPAHPVWIAPTYPYVHWGVNFLDYDNDTWPDVYIVNGHALHNANLFGSSYPQPSLLFRNSGKGKYTEVSETSGKALSVPRVSRGATFGDYDNDGDVDIFINNNNSPATLLRNEGGNQESLVDREACGGSQGSGVRCRRSEVRSRRSRVRGRGWRWGRNPTSVIRISPFQSERHRGAGDLMGGRAKTGEGGSERIQLYVAYGFSTSLRYRIGR